MPSLATKLEDTLPCGVLLMDATLRVRAWNRWLVQKTGISEQQARGKTLPELFADFHSPRLLSAIGLCIKHKSPQLISQTLNRYVLPIPLTVQIHDLTMMQQQVNVAPLTDSRGETLAVVSINDVTENVAKSSALAQLAKKLESQSNRDQLTGAYNRHFLWAWLMPQLKQCVRHSQALSCLMLDIDHFKRINDTYGHDVGDAVLSGFASLLNEQLRDSDILVRYGGEEFVVLLTHAEVPAALEIANRILETARATAIAPLDAGEVRCSIGVASWTPDDPCSAEELLKEADRHLYQAKQGGRDRIVVHQLHQQGYGDLGDNANL
jgi:diguanylate cyclase (GGDEF)-like protein